MYDATDFEKYEKSVEFIKYEFSEDEKRTIALEMAQKVSDKEQAESEKKAVVSEYKGRIDGLSMIIQEHAKKLNNGYEWKNMTVYRIMDYPEKMVRFMRPDTYQVVKTRPMTQEEMQLKLH